jgi:cytochrome c
MRLLGALGFLVVIAVPSVGQEQVHQLFRRCAACHALGEGASHRVGPHLNGTVGRLVGGLDDYDYSQVLEQAGEEGQVWTRELLVRYLKSPSHLFPGTKMNFAGMTKRDEIEELITYLEGFSPEGTAADR